jgi:cytochrome c556
MHSRKWVAAGAVGLALAVVVLSSTAGAADDVPKEIRDEVTKMADAVGKSEKIDKDAATFFKKYDKDLKKTMWVFKPREEDGKGGFGIGPQPGKYNPDGIEVYLAVKSNPMRGRVTAAELKDGADDFNRLADVTIAMAEITHRYIPKKAPPGAVLKNWTKYADDMKKGAGDLKAAVKAQKTDDAKKAFQTVYSACANCHMEFR